MVPPLWCKVSVVLALGNSWTSAKEMFCDVTGPCKSVGPSHTIHLRVDGSAFSIGRNNFGQLGDGTRIHATKPVLVSSQMPVTYVSVGGWHSLLLRNDGQAIAVGKNELGQLGDGTTMTSPFPRKMLGGSGAISVSAGYQHSLILKRDGTAFSAGGNECGQLGVGDYAFRHTPVHILNNVTSLSAGESHSLFVKSDGTVWGVGCNEYGQLGDSTTLGRTTVSQADIDKVVMVIAGQHKSLFIKEDGTVWASGQADDEIGYTSGPDWPRSTPVQVATKLDEVDAPGGPAALERAILGQGVERTDQRFRLDDPYYAQGLPELDGIGFKDWNNR